MGLPSAPWETVKVRYHFEEAIIIKSLMVELEYVAGVVTAIINGLGSQPGWGEQAHGVTASSVFQTMSLNALPMARERAALSKAAGVLSNDAATEIHNARMKQYAEPIRSSAQCSEPIPTSGFGMGYLQSHPTGALLGIFADNLCEALEVGEELSAIAHPILQVAVMKKRSYLMQKSVPTN